MKIGFICKYPPITGGEASKTYWLTKALAKNGHEIHIITNAQEVENEYREKFKPCDIDNWLKQKNLFIHSTSSEKIPKYIPQSNPFEIKLASITLDVIQKYKLDIIDSWYLVPNAIAGFMVHKITKIPWVLRHAGSDLGKLLPHHLFKPLLVQILKSANKIITYKSCENFFQPFGIENNKLWFNNSVSVNTECFNPSIKPVKFNSKNKPIIMAIGKIGEFKGTFDLLEAFLPLKDKALLVFITGDSKLDIFRKKIQNLGLEKSVKIIPPVPPWQIPNYIQSATCIVHVERDFPIIQHRPILPREVIACGKCLLLSEEMYKKYFFLKKDENVFVTNPHDHKAFSKQLKIILNESILRETVEKEAYKTSKQIEDFNSYIATTESFYQSLL